MRRLVWDSSFRRAFKRVTRRAPELASRILEVVATLAEDPFDRRLKTHRLRLKRLQREAHPFTQFSRFETGNLQSTRLPDSKLLKPDPINRTKG